MPGPGFVTVEYDWSKNGKNPGFGSSKRGSVAGAALGPGPGNYNPSERTLSAAPAYSMGYKKHGKGEGTNSPGPGAYNPQVDYSKENLGGVRIGTSTRD